MGPNGLLKYSLPKSVTLRTGEVLTDPAGVFDSTPPGTKSPVVQFNVALPKPSMMKMSQSHFHRHRTSVYEYK